MCFCRKEAAGIGSLRCWDSVSGASAPPVTVSLGSVSLQCCLGLGQFPGSVQPHHARSKAGSWSSGVLALGSARAPGGEAAEA